MIGSLAFNQSPWVIFETIGKMLSLEKKMIEKQSVLFLQPDRHCLGPENVLWLEPPQRGQKFRNQKQLFRLKNEIFQKFHDFQKKLKSKNLYSRLCHVPFSTLCLTAVWLGNSTGKHLQSFGPQRPKHAMWRDFLGCIFPQDKNVYPMVHASTNFSLPRRSYGYFGRLATAGPKFGTENEFFGEKSKISKILLPSYCLRQCTSKRG